MPKENIHEISQIIELINNGLPYNSKKINSIIKQNRPDLYNAKLNSCVKVYHFIHNIYEIPKCKFDITKNAYFYNNKYSTVSKDYFSIIKHDFSIKCE
jgi:hypothetical protein